jgi:hypothetical protein
MDNLSTNDTSAACAGFAGFGFGLDFPTRTGRFFLLPSVICGTTAAGTASPTTTRRLDATALATGELRLASTMRLIPPGSLDGFNAGDALGDDAAEPANVAVGTTVTGIASLVWDVSAKAMSFRCSGVSFARPPLRSTKLRSASALFVTMSPPDHAILFVTQRRLAVSKGTCSHAKQEFPGKCWKTPNIAVSLQTKVADFAAKSRQACRRYDSNEQSTSTLLQTQCRLTSSLRWLVQTMGHLI